MKTKLKRWRRRRKFIKAYKILRDEARIHERAGHNMDFRAVNEGFIVMICKGCTDLTPML